MEGTSTRKLLSAPRYKLFIGYLNWFQETEKTFGTQQVSEDESLHTELVQNLQPTPSMCRSQTEHDLNIKESEAMNLQPPMHQSDVVDSQGTISSSISTSTKVAPNNHDFLTNLQDEQRMMPTPTPITPCVSKDAQQLLSPSDQTPKQYLDLDCVQFNAISPFSRNLAGFSEPPSVLPECYDWDTQGPRSACLPLRNSPGLDFAIPSITSDDFHFDHPRPPSSTSEEPSSTGDRTYVSSETSWVPDSDEDCTPRKISRKGSCRIPDSDSTIVSFTGIDELINASDASSPPLVRNDDFSDKAHSTENVVTSSTQDLGDPQPSAIIKGPTSRWKKADPSTWKKNINKNNKHSCNPYQNASGKTMPAKKPKPVVCMDRGCRFKCNELTEEDRVNLCKSYWSLTGFKEQKQFILRHVKQQPPKRRNNVVKTKNRNSSREYYFFKHDAEMRVCSTFFMATLSISNGPINRALKNVDEFGEFIGTDDRGKKEPANKSNPEDLKFLRDHIESFPTMESHYCRKSSKRMYLDQKLSIAKMYQLYKNACSTQNKTPLSCSKYRNVFGTDYNYSFYSPKKDQCSLCHKYKKDPIKYEALYREHQDRKTSSNEAKQRDKERSQNDDTFLSVTADLQSVLQIPSGDVGELYYTRKLCVYNFTIYEAKPPNKGFCFMWNEINGKRGSSEIATCLSKWIQTLPDSIKEVSVFSDTCSGQNRNQFIAAFLLHLIQTSHLEVIEQKFLESGHTMMEVDSMHSAIECERKRTSIFSMNDWKNVAKRARSIRHRKDAPPYQVQEIKYNDIIDTKELAATLITNKTMAQDGKKVQWLKIKCLRYEKTNPGIIKFRYGYDGEYSVLDTTKKTRSKKGPADPGTSGEMILPKAYTSILPITQSKKKDLINLCRTDIIPVEFHSWFQSLPVNNQPDRLPEPDTLEDTDGEDS